MHLKTLQTKSIQLLWPGRWPLLIAVLFIAVACGMRPAPIMEKMNARLDAMPAPEPPYIDGISYKNTLFGEVKLDLYLPYSHQEDRQADTSKHPVYVHVHGGSWLFGNRKFARFADPLIEALRQSGIAVISIDYRKVNQVGFHSMVDDAVDSLRWLGENAEQYHLDIDQVVLHGPSAGGHLVLMMALTHEVDDLNVRLVIDEYGPTDLPAIKDLETGDRPNLLRIFPDFRLRSVSPINYLRADLPPIYIVHGEVDEMVPLTQSTGLQAALEKLGADVELDIVAGGNHGLLNVGAEEKEQLSRKRLKKILAALDQEVTETTNNL